MAATAATKSKLKASRSNTKTVVDKRCASNAIYEALSQEKTRAVMEVDNVDSLEEILKKVISPADLTYNLRDGIVLDYYVAAMWWARSQCYSMDQTAAFYLVIDTLIKNTEKQMSLFDNLREFSIMCGSVRTTAEDSPTTPSDSLCLNKIFDNALLSNMASYLYTTLFQHYKLYLTVYGELQECHIVGLDYNVETPEQRLWPPPLVESIREETLNEFQSEKKASGAPTDFTQQTPSKILSDKIMELDILATLSENDVKRVIEQVFNEMLVGLSDEVTEKLRQKEAEFIERINRVQIIKQT